MFFLVDKATNFCNIETEIKEHEYTRTVIIINHKQSINHHDHPSIKNQ